jgi:hypothetical protein
MVGSVGCPVIVCNSWLVKEGEKMDAEPDPDPFTKANDVANALETSVPVVVIIKDAMFISVVILTATVFN